MTGLCRLFGQFWAQKLKKFTQNFFYNFEQKPFDFFYVYLMPESIITDYESGVIAAVKKMLVVSTHWGCWFHFSNVYFENFKILIFKKAIKTKT